MRQPFERFTFTRPEISAFRELSKRRISVSELATSLNRSTASASHIIKSLQNKGLVQIQKTGMRKEVSIAQNNHAQLLSDLIKNEPGVPWEVILSYSAMNMLLDRFERLNLTDVSKSTKWRAMRNLAMHGMLSDPSQVASNERVKRFLDSYTDFVSRAFALQILPSNAAIVWSSGFRYLFRVGKGRELKGDFIKTAVSALPSYGIQLVTNDEYYFYAQGVHKLSLDDVVIHTFRIDPTSQAYATYALLAIFKNIKKVNFESLLRKAGEYGIRQYAESIKQYIDSRGNSQAWPLPPWGELKEQASLYGVDL